jgi:hypothetical protein
LGLRFHRSFKLFPGVRLNLSKSGPSASFGTAGATFNIGPRGTRSTIGVPGTGLSYVKYGSLGGGADQRPARHQGEEAGSGRGEAVAADPFPGGPAESGQPGADQPIAADDPFKRQFGRKLLRKILGGMTRGR